MRKERLLEEQMVKILREADKRNARRGGGETPRRERRHDLHLAEAIRAVGAGDVKRLRQLEQGNGRLKEKLVAERDLEVDVMKEIYAKNTGRRADGVDGSRLAHERRGRCNSREDRRQRVERAPGAANIIPIQ
jgi:putative transposase